MPPYTIIEKQVGETPLQAVERFRADEGIPAEVSLAYAGRLDPMASGALLVLIGEECKKVAAYNNVDKTYRFEVLLGYTSDTRDVLGLAETCEAPEQLTDAHITKTVESFAGKWDMAYPVYSSKPVEGKPLFRHVYDGTIDDIEIPTKEVNIYTITYKGKRTISGSELLSAIEEKVNSLQLDPKRTMPGNDFRKTEILAHWRELLKNEHVKHRVFDILECEAHVSAGTYIRALAPAIASNLGTCGLALSIHRTHIYLNETGSKK